MSFMLRARTAGSARHELVGSDSLVNRRLHAIMIGDRETAEEYARWLLRENAGPEGFDSVQVNPAGPQGAKPVAVFAAADASPPEEPRS